MKDIKRILVLASLFLPFLSAGVFGAQEIAIQAGTILPISGAPIEHGTILIKDGKIAALGQNVAVGADTRVIDASGGLDEQTALEAITITAAEIIGVADRVGSLQVGKDADIIILDGHPFHHKTFVESTLINGKVLYEKAKSIYFSHITNDE